MNFVNQCEFIYLFNSPMDIDITNNGDCNSYNNKLHYLIKLIFGNKFIMKCIWLNVTTINITLSKPKKMCLNQHLRTLSRAPHHFDSLTFLVENNYLDLLRAKIRVTPATRTPLFSYPYLTNDRLALPSELIKDYDLFAFVYSFFVMDMAKNESTAFFFLQQLVNHENSPIYDDLLHRFCTQLCEDQELKIDLLLLATKGAHLKNIVQIIPYLDLAMINCLDLSAFYFDAIHTTDFAIIQFAIKVIKHSCMLRRATFNFTVTESHVEMLYLILIADGGVPIDKITDQQVKTFDMLISSYNNNVPFDQLMPTFEVSNHWKKRLEMANVQKKNINGATLVLMAPEFTLVDPDQIIYPLLDLNDPNLNSFIINHALGVIYMEQPIPRMLECICDVISINGFQLNCNITQNYQNLHRIAINEIDFSAFLDKSPTLTLGKYLDIYKYILEVCELDEIQNHSVTYSSIAVAAIMQNLEFFRYFLTYYRKSLDHLATIPEIFQSKEIMLHYCQVAPQGALRYMKKWLYDNLESSQMVLENDFALWLSCVREIYPLLLAPSKTMPNFENVLELVASGLMNVASYSGDLDTITYLHNLHPKIVISAKYAINGCQIELLNYLLNKQIAVLDEISRDLFEKSSYCADYYLFKHYKLYI